MTLCIWASVIDCLSFALLIVFGENLPLGPIIPMIMISLATSATPSLDKACVPIVAPREALGTAFSLYSVSESLGASVGHVGLGYLRDRSMNYTKDLMVMFLVSFVAGLATVGVRWLDAKHLDGLLEGKGRL